MACLFAFTAGGRAGSGDPDCTGSYGSAAPRAGAPLRFGVDPGLAGSFGGAQLPSTPDDTAKDVAAARALRPPGRVLVVRLNRLFWSGGDAAIARFESLVSGMPAPGWRSSSRSVTTRAAGRTETWRRGRPTSGTSWTSSVPIAMLWR